MRIGKALVSGGIMAAILTTPLTAQETPSKDDKEQDLSDVVVTATKTTRTTENVANSVTVVDEEEIKAKAHHTVADVIAGTPGVDLTRNGGPGTIASVFMRGADSKNVLLLVDGIPYNNPAGLNRNAALSHLSTSNVERIEIIRGPQSVLYGSNATAGVINVITKEGKGVPSVTYKVEGGSYDTYRNTLSSSGTIDRLSYSLTADSYETNGFSVANSDNKDIPDDGNKNEEDGYRSTTYSGHLKYRVTDDFTITLTGRHTEGEVELDDYNFLGGYTGDKFPWPALGPYRHEGHTEESLVRLDLDNSFADGMFESKVYGSYSEFKSQEFDDDGAQTFDGFGRTEQYGWQGNLNTTDNIFTLGTDLYREFYETESSGIDENADTRSLWVQDQVELGGFYFLAGARYDRHDRFGENTTWRTASAYTFESNTKIKASYGTGFRAPSLFELYSFFGNPNLEPEESIGWDAGIEQSVGDSFMVGATYFVTEYNELIDFDFATFTYNQVDGDTDVQGVEFYTQWQASDSLHFLLNYTYTDTEADDGSRLVRRPTHKAMLSTNLKVSKKAGATVDVHYVGERDEVPSALDQFGNPVGELDQYLLVNLSAYYQVCSGFKVFGRVDNVTDEDYELAWSYATPGRSYYLGCSLTF